MWFSSSALGKTGGTGVAGNAQDIVNQHHNLKFTPMNKFLSRSISLSATAAIALVPAAGMPTAAHAQATKAAKTTQASAVAKQPKLVGTWTGTATVPLADSSIVVPVTYTFTESAAGIAGTAMVPGQGMGPISNVVRDGSQVKFRVTVEKNILEHDGKIASDGTFEGMVNMNNLPVAKFKIKAKS